MYMDMIRQAKTAVLLLLSMTVLTGIFYPLLITGLATIFFPWQANGSLIEQGNKKIGSQLIGQSFTSLKYFWGRPSATSPFPYNSNASSGSNFGPTNPEFLIMVKKRVSQFKEINLNTPIPVDLVTASGSGLDPELSPLAAFYQIPRIAAIRKISETELFDLVRSQIKHRSFGFLGEPRVNVLQLNIALDNRK